MICADLKTLANQLELDDECNFMLRVAFGIDCINRVEHLLVDEDILACLMTGKDFVAGNSSRECLDDAATIANARARSHHGTNSVDGSGSAAVSSSYGVAAALAGHALQAAGYAAYASVYAYASHAVTEPSAYLAEHNWQVHKLRELAALKESRPESTTTYCH